MSSIWSSLSGVRTHQFMLDVIGNNLANANTNAFKASRVTFSEMISQTLSPASSPTATMGGRNPVQIGLGVEVGAVTRDFSQGGLKDTGNPLDLTMDGDGFMVVHDGSNMAFSRSSTFGIDANNYLVDSVTGFRLLNLDNEAIRIPFDEQIPANQTGTIKYSGNLSADAAVPETELLSTISPLEAGGAAVNAGTDLNAIDTVSGMYVAGDTIEIAGTDRSGATFTSTFTYGVDGMTVGELITSIDTAFGAEATATLEADGTIRVVAAERGDASFSLGLSNGGANGVDWSEHSLYVTTDGSNGGTRKSSIITYDSRGKAHIIAFNFTRVSEREWNLTAELSDDDGTLTKAQVDGIRFNTDGSFNSVAEQGATAQQIVIDFGSAADGQSIALDFGASGGFGGLTMFGGTSSAAASGQDGFSAGMLKDITIGADGKIEGVYTNGQLRDVATVLVATFDNPEGLESLGKGVWGSTVNSGEPVLGTAMSGRAGALSSAVLEGSNVESSEELTNLIIAQNGFQLSARAMAVSNRIIQELANVV